MARKKIGLILIEMGYVTQGEVDAGLETQNDGDGDKNEHKTDALIVENEDLVAGVVALKLTQLGYAPVRARSGREAERIHRALKDEIELIVLDAGLPDKSGQDVLRELKRVNPRVRVVLTTSVIADDVVSGFIEDRANGVLPKPYTMEELGRAIKGPAI